MDSEKTFAALVLPMVRHGLQLLAGFLVARGELDATNAETLTGGVIALATVAWWYATRRA